MASGETVMELGITLPPTSFAALTAFAGGSTPNELYRVAAFDASTVEYVDFEIRVNEKYNGGGVKLQIPWTSSVADATKNVVWKGSFRKLTVDSSVMTASFTYTTNAQTVTDANCGTAYTWQLAEITFTNGTQMDSLVAGDRGVLRIWRDASNGSDTLASDALMLRQICVLEV